MYVTVRWVVDQPGTEQLNSFNDYFRKWYHDQQSHQSSPMPALRHLTVESLTEPFNEVIKRQQEVLRFFVALNGEELRGKDPDALNTINTLYDFTRPSIQTTRKRNRCMSCKKEPEKIDPLWGRVRVGGIFCWNALSNIVLSTKYIL